MSLFLSPEEDTNIYYQVKKLETLYIQVLQQNKHNPNHKCWAEWVKQKNLPFDISTKSDNKDEASKAKICNKNYVITRTRRSKIDKITEERQKEVDVEEKRSKRKRDEAARFERYYRVYLGF